MSDNQVQGFGYVPPASDGAEADPPAPAVPAAQPAPADAAAAQLADQLSPDADTAELASKITQLPAGVTLATNLDTYENEKPEKPFWFQHGGGFFHLLDPDNVDFQDIVIVQENPRLMMHVLLDPQQRGAFADATGKMPLTVGKMKKLVSDYTRHHGLTNLGELDGSARS